MNVNPNFEEYHGGTARLWFGGSMEAVSSVAIPGQAIDVRLNFVERATRVTAVALDIRGETLTWSCDRMYLVSTDGSTWSAPMTLSALQAMTFNPAMPLYIGLKFTASGTPAGQIELWHCQVNYEYSISGVSGRRVIPMASLYTSCRELVEQLVDQISPLYDERKHFQFAWGTGEKCVPDGNRPNVFCHDLKIRERNRNSNHRQASIAFRMGIRRKCSPKHQQFEEFRGIIKHRLGEAAQEFTYDFTIGGVRHLGVRLADLGFWGVMTTGDSEISGSDQSSAELSCGCTWWETSVQFEFLIKFGKNLR